MINLAVINLKGIFKKIFKFIILIIIIGIVVNNIKSINLDKINIFSTISEASTESIEKNISIAKYFEEGNKGKESNIKKILEGELALFLTTEEKLMEKENQEEVIEFEENEKDKSEVENPVKEENNTTKEETKLAEANVDLEKISTKLDTKIIDENNKTDNTRCFTNQTQIQTDLPHPVTDDAPHSFPEHTQAQKDILQALSLQHTRYGRTNTYNGDLSSQDISVYVKMTSSGQKLLQQAADRLKLSARAYFKVIKVAQTIADLDQSTEVGTEQIAEALAFRQQI